ncbi:hypothetical protein ACJX0J_038577, partial [Zea mays]
MNNYVTTLRAVAFDTKEAYQDNANVKDLIAFLSIVDQTHNGTHTAKGVRACWQEKHICEYHWLKLQHFCCRFSWNIKIFLEPARDQGHHNTFNMTIQQAIAGHVHLTSLATTAKKEDGEFFIFRCNHP